MSINTGYYINPTDMNIELAYGSGGYTFKDTITLKMPNFGATGSTYNSQWRAMSTAAGTDPEILNQDMDPSISYAAADDGFEMCHITAVRGVPTSSDTVINTSISRKGSPLSLDYHGTWYDGTTSRSSNFAVYTTTEDHIQYKSSGSATVWDDAPWAYEYNHTIATSSGNTFAHTVDGNISPVMKFAMKNFMWGLVVLGCKLLNGKSWDDLHYVASSGDNSYTANTEIKAFDLDRYCTEGYQEYPYIIGIYLVPYITGLARNEQHLAVNPSGFTLWIPGKGITYKHTFTSTDGDITKTIAKHKTWHTSLTSVYVNKISDNTAGGTTNVSYATMIWGAAGVGTGSKYAPVGYVYNDYMVFGTGGTIKYLASSSANYQQGTYGYMVYYRDSRDIGDADAIREYLRKQVAYTGMLFVEALGGMTDYFSPDYDNVNLFMGVIDGDGYTHGEYVRGADVPKQSHLNWTDPAEETPLDVDDIDGPVAPDSEIESDTTNYPSYVNTGFGLCGYHYLVSQLDIFDIKYWIKAYNDYDLAKQAAFAYADTDPATAQAFKDLWVETYPDQAAWSATVYDKFGYGVNPVNDIISLMAFPFDLVRAGCQYDSLNTGFILGGESTNAYYYFYEYLPEASRPAKLTGTHVTDDGILYVPMGEIDIEPYYEDFRDYAPYSRIELQIPFHGSTILDPAEWIGHKCKITCIADICTGSSIAVVERDGSTVITIPGTVGFNVPLTLDNYAQTSASLMALSASYQNSQISAETASQKVGLTVMQGIGGATVTAALGAATGNPVASLGGFASGMINTVANTYYAEQGSKQAENTMKATEYSTEHTQAGRFVMGTASPMASQGYELCCRIVRHYPRLIPGCDINKYAKTVGHACNISGNVGDFKGYTVFSNVCLDSIDCLDSEKQMILAALQSGVII